MITLRKNTKDIINKNHDYLSSNAVTKPPDYESSIFDSDGTVRSRSSLSSSSSQSTALTYASSSYSNTTLVEEDEKGSQNPPPYSVTLYHKDEVWVKSELVSPFTRTTIRKWRRSTIEINNTQLKLTQSSVGGLISTSRVYSLQFAEVGLASDYTKKQFSIRIRVEGKQFLISFDSCERMQANLVALMMGISLSLPLELRQLPEEIKRTRNLERDRERRQRRRKMRAQAAEIQRLLAEHGITQPEREQRNTTETTQHNEPVKWYPSRRRSRFSEKDYPHLIFNSPWEGKSLLFGGKWATVHMHKIYLMPSKLDALSNTSH